MCGVFVRIRLFICDSSFTDKRGSLFSTRCPVAITSRAGLSLAMVRLANCTPVPEEEELAEEEDTAPLLGDTPVRPRRLFDDDEDRPRHLRWCLIVTLGLLLLGLCVHRRARVAASRAPSSYRQRAASASHAKIPLLAAREEAAAGWALSRARDAGRDIVVSPPRPADQPPPPPPPPPPEAAPPDCVPGRLCATPQLSPVRQGGAVAAVATAAATSTAHASLAADFDGTLDAALRAAVPTGAPRLILATFGNSGVKEHLLNFVSHVRKCGSAHVVGAVDAAVFELLKVQGTPVYKTPLALRAYKMDGSNSHSSRSWKQFASMRTGEVAKMVEAGYSVLHTDSDIIWLRDPTPFLLCTPAAEAGEFSAFSSLPCAALRSADVAVSSDNMGPGRALTGGAAYHAGGTFNSGILFFRATPAGKSFARHWHSNVANPQRGSRYSSLTSDQQVFNNMVRRPHQWPGIESSRKGRDAHRREPPDRIWTMDVDASIGPWAVNLSLGALPLPLFANGHGYFVQRAHTRLRVAPFCVHATYSLDMHDGVAKAQRFREAGLWDVSPPEYFNGRFLALNSSTPTAALERAQRGHTHATLNHIGTHRAALQAYVAELRDALALARALKRTLVLPRWTCYCDRLWAGSDNIVAMKCMYPGSQQDNFLPFECPMDHVLSPAAWRCGGACLPAPRTVTPLVLPPGTRMRSFPSPCTGALVYRTATHPFSNRRSWPLRCEPRSTCASCRTSSMMHCRLSHRRTPCRSAPARPRRQLRSRSMTAQRCCGSSTRAVYCAGSAAAMASGHSTPWPPRCSACPTGAHGATRAVPSSSANFLGHKRSAMLRVNSGA